MSEVTRQVGAVLRIPIGHVHPGPNARGNIGDVGDLATSIAAIGLLEPLIVTEREDGEFEVFEGHRRLAACQRAGLPHVDAIVKKTTDPATRAVRQLAMHALAKAFDPIAEAHALHELIFNQLQRSDQVARALGKSQSWISARLALLNLTPAEATQVREGRMPLHQAQAVVAQRRAERDGRTQPPTPRHAATSAPAPARRHCQTCTCDTRTTR